MEEMVVEGSQVEERCAIVQPPLLVAKLTTCPQTLYELWKEYEFVYGGCKPKAVDFTGEGT